MRAIKRLWWFLFFISFCCQNGSAQTAADRTIHNNEFNWTITIPDGFSKLSAEEWDKLQNKGATAIEKTTNQKVVSRPKTIFALKADAMDYFESNYQPYDVATDGDYVKSCIQADDVIYQTFQGQMPGVQIDTIRTVETVADLPFQKFRASITLPNQMVLQVLLYSHLFTNKEFSVSMVYIDKEKGKKMIDSWLASKFEK